MEGDGTYAHKYQNLDERSSRLSAFEIIQTIIGVNLLIATVVSVCISALKKDNKNNHLLYTGNSPQNLDKFWRAIYYEINR